MSSRLLYRGNWTFSVRKEFVLDPMFSTGAKVLYLALRSHCSPAGDTAYPSATFLAKCLGVSRETVNKYCSELKAAGLVETEQRNSTNGRFAHTLYTLLDEASRGGKKPLRERSVADLSDTKIPHSKEELTKEEDLSAGAVSLNVESDDPNREQVSSPSPFIQFRDGWFAAYEQVFGRKYLFNGGKDGQAIKRLLMVETAENLLSVAKEAWARGGRLFHCKRASSICGFAGAFNDIRVELTSKGYLRQSTESNQF